MNENDDERGSKHVNTQPEKVSSKQQRQQKRKIGNRPKTKIKQEKKKTHIHRARKNHTKEKLCKYMPASGTGVHRLPSDNADNMRFTECDLVVTAADERAGCVPMQCGRSSRRVASHRQKLHYYYGGPIENRTYGTHKNLHTHLFLLTMFGPIYYGPRVITRDIVIGYPGNCVAPNPLFFFVGLRFPGDVSIRGLHNVTFPAVTGNHSN